MKSTFYVWKENEEAYSGIEKKQELINKLLKVYFDKHKNPTGPEPLAKFVPLPPDPETGYPCCQAKKPCRHWHWDGVSGVWVNETTGKTREAA